MPTDRQQWITLGFMLSVAGLVVLYDVLAYRSWGTGATISRVSLRCSEAWPVLYAVGLFGLGVLVGHCFLPQPGGR